MNIEELKKELFKQDKFTIKVLIFQLLEEKKLSYTDLSKLYVSVLEKKEKLANTRESMFATYLGWSIGGTITKKDNSFFHSRCYVLLEKWLPDEWLEKYLNERTDEHEYKFRLQLKGE